MFFIMLHSLFFGAIAAAMALNWLEHTDESRYGDLIFICIFIGCCVFTILGIIGIIDSVIWKCTVQGNQIYYRSLFYRGGFSVCNIKQIESFSFFATMPGEDWRLSIVGKKNPLIVYSKSVNSLVFLDYLRSKEIPGANKIYRPRSKAK